MYTVAMAGATCLTICFMHCLYAFATLALARLVRQPVFEVKLGMGPRLLRCKWAGTNIDIAAIPLGSSVGFRDPDEIPEDSIHPEVPAGKLFLLCIFAPLLYLVIGTLLLAVAILLGDGQWQVLEGQDASVDPSAVPGLAVTQTESSWSGQLQLTADTFGVFVWRLLTFQSLSEWGGLVGFVVTTAGMAQHSLASWCTAIGVMFFGTGVAHFVPIPPHTGFQTLHALYRIGLGRPLPFKLVLILIYMGIVFSLVMFCRILYIDARWMIATWW